MEAFIARAAGEKLPAMGYIDCPCLHGPNHKEAVKRPATRKNQDSRLFTFTVCVFYSQPSKRVGDLSHASGRDGVAGRVGGPRHTSCTDSSTGETHTGTSYIRQCVRSDASLETFRILRDYTAYLRQGRSQERPAEGRRPLGCRTAEDGGGSCEGAAPPAHC